ncbi:TSUP family transporter [Geodermatophilus sp. URMC 63]
MDAGWLPSLGLAAAVALGAGTQRITGLGFALVSAPFLVLLLGPFAGVLVVNVLGVAAAVLVLAQVRRDVDVRRGLLLSAPALLAVLPGAWVARHTAPAVLQVLVGGSVVVALLALLVIGRRSGARGGSAPGTGPGPVVLAGAASGFMNATAGVGGPALTVYAVATGWPQRAFAATAQLCFTVIGAATVAAKGLPSLPVVDWAVAAAALAAGLVAGTALSTRVRPSAARAAALALALVGSLATVVDGLLGG